MCTSVQLAAWPVLPRDCSYVGVRLVLLKGFVYISEQVLK